MAEPHVVTALVRKRAELLGLIERREREAEALRLQLAHLDATLLLFKPDADPAAVRPKRPAQRTGYFRRGTLARACLSLLRRADGPLCTRELALRVLAERGVAAPDRALVRTVTKSVSKALRGLPRDTVGREPGPGQTVLWRTGRVTGGPVHNVNASC